MNNKKLIQIIKKNRIEQLENELNELINLRREYDLELDSLNYDISEYLNFKEQILSNVKQIKKSIGDSRKIKTDLEMIRLHLVSVIQKMNKNKYFECTIDEYIQALEHKSKEFEERIKDKSTEVNKLKKEVKIEIDKILKRIEMTGGRKIDTSLQGISNAITFKKTVVKYTHDVNYDIIENYFEMLKELEGKKRVVRNTHEALNWIKRNKSCLPQILNTSTLQNLENELQQSLEFLENSKKQIGIIDKKLREKEKKKKLVIEKLKKFEQKYKEKEKRIKEEQNRINKIESLEKLQMTREEALKTLGQEETSYMVIPIPEDIMTKSELFNYFKEINIKTDDTEIDTAYQADTLTGVINSNYCIKDEKRVLLVKLSEISLENIARINNDGTMVLTKFEIPDSSLLITADKQEDINWDCTVLTFDKDKTTLKEKVKDFLQDDFTEDPNEYKDYSMFKGFHKNTYTEGEKERIKEVIRVMHSNYFSIEGKEIILDGKREVLEDLIKRVIGNIEDINEVISLAKSQDKFADDNNKIEMIALEIDKYLEEPKRNIEIIYKQLLHQYLKDNPKARAFYNDEGNTKVKINGRIISMKPKLPQDDEDLEKRLFRKEEDKIYKEMKTAALCNKLAHLYDSQIRDQKTQENPRKFEIYKLKRKRTLMYSQKNKLIKRIIKKAKTREDISIGKVKDIRGLGISMDIPGYTTIVLHVGDGNSSIIGNEIETYTYIDGRQILKIKENDADNYVTTGIMIRRSK